MVKEQAVMRNVIHNNETYAVIVTSEDFEPGTKFVSDPGWPLQLGLLMPTAGHVIQAHVHLPHEARLAGLTQEFLFVVSGKMEVKFYDELGEHFHAETIVQGEGLLQVKGGHAFRFLEDARLLEVKQGPYLGRHKDKALMNT
jgi:hypothetical protein